MKKLLRIILPITVAAVLAVGTAFAAWIFPSIESSSNELVSKVDDILENYDIKVKNVDRTNTVKTYEMYLYPSTLYINDYVDCLNGKAGAVLPEEKYGYIEPAVRADGTVEYKVVTPKGQGGDNGYLGDVAENDDNIDIGGTYADADKNIYTIETGVYYNVYQSSRDWNKSDTSAGLGGAVTVGTQTVDARMKYLYGDPELDETVVDHSEITNSKEPSERHNWRNLHYFDRFGYWATLARGDGRYLPIKLTINEDFSNNYFKDVTMTPLSDMSDPHNWFVYSFSCWAYVDFSESGEYTLPYFATDEFAKENSSTKYVDIDENKNVISNPSLGSFCPTTVSQYFDIIESFDKYSDNDGVIRLFPKFSNGKGYDSSSIKDGGGDAIKAVVSLKNDDGTASTLKFSDQHELFMFYSTDDSKDVAADKQPYTVNGQTVHVSVLPNVDIAKYYSLTFRLSLTERYAGWEDWYDIYAFGRGKSGTSSASNKDIDETIQSYGYGMYNLYLFVTHVATSGDKTDHTADLEALRQSLVNKSYKENGVKAETKPLFGKNLLPIATVNVQYSSYYQKSFMLVGEKVREAKFIGNINFGGADEMTDDDIVSEYLNGQKTFRLINKTLFGYPKNSTGTADKVQINRIFPYCYILQNVDFTEATTQYCQIRFQRYYRPDLHFIGKDDYAYDNIEFSDTTYVPAFGNYFALEDINVSGYDETQQVIRLADEEKRGVYDIIMVFRSAREADPNSEYAYNIGLYAYRHTNIFLKLYDSDRTGEVEYYQDDNGEAVKITADTPVPDGRTIYSFVDHSATPLFIKSYPIGVSIRGSDESDPGASNASKTTLAACVNKAISGDPTAYRLYDHVTQAEVARYVEKPVEDGVASDLYLYDGKYYELVFEPFKIRKNYIFYIKKV